MNESQRDVVKLELTLRSLISRQASAAAAGDAATEQALRGQIDEIKKQLKILRRDLSDTQDDVEKLSERVAAIGNRQVQGGGGGITVVQQGTVGPVNGYFPMGWN